MHLYIYIFLSSFVFFFFACLTFFIETNSIFKVGNHKDGLYTGERVQRTWLAPMSELNMIPVNDLFIAYWCVCTCACVNFANASRAIKGFDPTID